MTNRKFAIVTGASTGIGFELASVAAEQGFDLLVVADEPLIESAAADFRTHGVDITTVQANLGTLSGVDDLLAATGGRAIDVLCANAGTGHGGAFLDQDFDLIRHTIDTNVTGTMYLLHKVMTAMVARGEGRVLVTGSIVGYIPGPFNATYNATKAFVDNITDAIREEIKKVEGVTLTTLMPGATETEFFARADMLDTNIGKAKKADPAKVARDGWNAAMAGEARITSGFMNKVQVAGAGLVPPAILAGMHRLVAKSEDDPS